MITKMLRTCGLFLLLSVSMISCKKNKIQTTDALTGAWEETGLTGFSRRLIFNPGGGFSMKITDASGQTSFVNGTYTTDGENLKIIVTEEINEKGQVIQPITVGKLFENATFSITNYVLSIKFTSYPADAPVKTELKYNKIIAID